MSLLQVQIKNKNLDIYILSNNTKEDIVLNITILLYITVSQRNLEEQKPIEKNILVTKKAEKISNNQQISKFSSDDNDFISLLSKYKEEEIRIVVKKIEMMNSKDNINKFYLDVNLGNNEDSQKTQSKDLSLIFSEESNSDYNIRIYKVKEISPCSEEYKFNITVDNKITGDEEIIALDFNMNMNSEFSSRGNNRPTNNSNGLSSSPKRTNDNNSNRTRAFKLDIECILSEKYNNIIPCQSSMETPNFNFTMNDYLSFDEKQLISISADKDFIFPLYCHEEPPITAIIFIVSIFLFVVIVVIVFIIFINKKGQGDKGYDLPNVSNSNNIIGFNSGVVSK